MDLHLDREELARRLREEVCGGFDIPLYIHPRTAQCLADGCIVCAYRLLVRLPRVCRKHAAPNKRPEQCLRTQRRMSSGQHKRGGEQFQNSRRGKSRRKRATSPRALPCTPESPPVQVTAPPSYPEISAAGLYAANARTLIIGDGDLSFSLGLCQKLNSLSGGDSSRTVVATTYLSHNELIRTYGRSVETHLQQMKELGVATVHSVDATCLGMSNCNVVKYFQRIYSEGARAKLPRFHRIIWNFPCVHSPLDASEQAQRGRDGQNEEMESNKRMLRRFFERAVNFLEPGGEVHIVHKTKPPYNQWDLSELVAESGMKLEAAVVFDRELYPGYTNRKALVGRGSFPISDARTFVFASPLVLRDGSGIQSTVSDDRCPLLLVKDELLLHVFALLGEKKKQQRLLQQQHGQRASRSKRFRK
eukprot:g3679.t1